MSVLEGATLEDDCRIGPFGHLRPGAYLERGVEMGNYGEVKAARLGAGTKMHHFGYIGDASVGKRVNIGAGTITMNYTAKRTKERTEIGDDAFIGSDSLLRAPVRVGNRSITGGGSVVTKDVPDDTAVVLLLIELVLVGLLAILSASEAAIHTVRRPEALEELIARGGRAGTISRRRATYLAS